MRATGVGYLQVGGEGYCEDCSLAQRQPSQANEGVKVRETDGGVTHHPCTSAGDVRGREVARWMRTQSGSPP